MATRDDLVSAVQANISAATGAECSKKDANTAIDAVLAGLNTTVMTETDNSLRTAIGTFKNKYTPERQARNPQTGEPVTVKAKNSLVFKASAAASSVEAPKAVAKKAAPAAGKKVLKKVAK